MAQRLNAINVGYRPLNPADDVAGFAGQRQAVTEFEAKSQDMARRAAEENARANTALRAQQIANQAMQAAVDSANNMKRAQMQIDMQQKELAQNAWISDMKLNQSQQQIDQAAAMMPLEMEGMRLNQEAQRIDNQYGHNRQRADLDGKRLLNEGRAADIDRVYREERELSTIPAMRQNYDRWVADGNDGDNFVHGFTTAAGQEAWQKELLNAKRSTQSQLIDAKNDKIEEKMLRIDPSQVADLSETDIYGNSLYRDKNGNLTDLGIDRLDNFVEMEKLITETERKKFTNNAKATSGHGRLMPSKQNMPSMGAGLTPAHLGPKLATLTKNGTLVPTEAGLELLRKNRAAEKESTILVSAVEDKDASGNVIGRKETRKPYDQLRQEKEDEIRKADTMRKKSPEQITQEAIESLALTHTASTTVADQQRAFREGRAINVGGTIIYPSGAQQPGQQPGQQPQAGPTMAYGTTNSAGGSAARALTAMTEINSALWGGGDIDLTYSYPYPNDKTVVSHDQDDYDKMTIANQTQYYGELMSDYGYTPEEAKEINKLGNIYDVREGDDTKNFRNRVVERLSSKALTPERDRIAIALGMQFGGRPQLSPSDGLRWDVRPREGDEITTELLLKDKKIASLVKNHGDNPEKWEGVEPQIPWQGETEGAWEFLTEWGEAEHIFGHNHLDRGKSKTKPFTFRKTDHMQIRNFVAAYRQLEKDFEILKMITSKRKK